MRKVWVVVFFVLPFCVEVGASEFVPFVIPAEVHPASPLNMKPKPIRGEADRIVVRDGHFHRGGERIRLWGVNFSFSANWPSHEDAEQIATRLAAAGVNAIRCHHMDTSQYPRGLWQKDGKTLEPKALERLDYFVNQLARRGIYINLNLHVGREHSKYLGLPKTNRKYDKMSNIFTPELIAAQKRYARNLLTRTNKYRNSSYAEDPAIAIVEITNENSLFMWTARKHLEGLPLFYKKILQDKYNAWLKKRYDSTAGLRKKWNADSDPLGRNMLKNNSFQDFKRGQNLPDGWSLEEHNGCRTKLSPVRYQGRQALRIANESIDGTDWHLQLNQRALSVKAGMYYTVLFQAVSEKPRKLQLSIGQSHKPWKGLGLSKQIELSPEWQSYRFGFLARSDEGNARLNFIFGNSKVPFYLASVEFRRGGLTGLAKDESIEAGSVQLFGLSELPERELDRMRFLADTEKDYFDEMRNYIKTDIGSKALVTGTAIYGPLGMYGQSDMDFIDSHAYWQHPRFPGRPWDRNNWYINQKAMTDNPEEATLFRLASQRLAGKPFTVTEYNHPMPLDSQAECVPMIASFAAAQDWDGVWIYSYSHYPDGWDKKMVSSYFDSWNNPAKWGFMRAGSAIFREAGIGLLTTERYAQLADSSDTVTELAQLHLKYDRDMFAILKDKAGISHQDMLKDRVIPGFAKTDPVRLEPTETATKLTWTVNDRKQGFYHVRGRGALAYTGHSERFQQETKGQIVIEKPSFVALTMTALDKRVFSQSKKVLITVCGRCENVGMKFSEDRRTVGRNWGRESVQIEPVEGELTLTALPAGHWRCEALGPDGMPTMEVPVSSERGKSVIKISSRYKTMWYLLARAPL